MKIQAIYLYTYIQYICIIYACVYMYIYVKVIVDIIYWYIGWLSSTEEGSSSGKQFW